MYRLNLKNRELFLYLANDADNSFIDEHKGNDHKQQHYTILHKCKIFDKDKHLFKCLIRKSVPIISIYSLSDSVFRVV